LQHILNQAKIGVLRKAGSKPASHERTLSMSCASFMNPNLITARETDTVGDAVASLLQNSISNLPVIDANGNLAGQFGLRRLISLLMPKAATLDGAMADLSFVTDSAEYIAERMGEIAPHPVSRYMDKDVPTVHPGTSLVEAMLLLYRNRSNLLVTDESGKLLGIISPRDVAIRFTQNNNKA
jgi:CBS-domain-containing membrane protein